MNKETKLINEAYDVMYLPEGYKEDTVKYIDGLLDAGDYDSKSKSFLEGLKKFVDEKGFLTPGQRGGLANFAKNSPVKTK